MSWDGGCVNHYIVSAVLAAHPSQWSDVERWQCYNFCRANATLLAWLQTSPLSGFFSKNHPTYLENHTLWAPKGADSQFQTWNSIHNSPCRIWDEAQTHRVAWYCFPRNIAMPSTDTSSTSLAIEMCFSCSVRPCEYKVACQLPCCDRFRGKIQVCSKCAEFCPNPKCRVRLRPEDLKTASHLSTLQTFTELRSLDVLVEQAPEAAKGKLNAIWAKGKGKRSKGRGKGKLQTSSEQQVGCLGGKGIWFTRERSTSRWRFVCQFNNVEHTTL